MKVQDIVNMNDHDKQTIYEAYSLETSVRKKMNKELNKERRLTAQLRFDSMAWRDAYLEADIRANVKVEGDIDDALGVYFSHPERFVVFTPSNGYYAGYEEDDHLFILFANHNPREWNKERKDMLTLIKSLASYGKPILYTGVYDVMKNHSEEIEPGLYSLKL